MTATPPPYGDPPPGTRISETELTALEGTFAPSVYRLAQEVRRYRAMLLGLAEQGPDGMTTWAKASEAFMAEVAAIRAERPKAPKP